MTRVGFAYHICELIDGLCPEGQEFDAVFILLKNTLDQLEKGVDNIADTIHGFEVELLSLLGFWHGSAEVSANLNTTDFIENIIERRLKSKRIFSSLE